jgi:hypothetical protein
VGNEANYLDQVGGGPNPLTKRSRAIGAGREEALGCRAGGGGRCFSGPGIAGSPA